MAKFQVEFPASRLSAFEESLKFVVIGPNKQPVETDGRETKSGVYELSFKCDVSGDYLVGTGLGKDSKYVEVSVLDPLEVLALESKLEVVGDVKLQSMVPVAFSVEFPTRLAAKKAVVVLGPDGKEISVKKEVHVQGSVRYEDCRDFFFFSSFPAQWPEFAADAHQLLLHACDSWKVCDFSDR